MKRIGQFIAFLVGWPCIGRPIVPPKRPVASITQDKIKFYVSYTQDCGWAMMACHGIILARDRVDAASNWEQRLRAQGFCVTPIPTPGSSCSYDALSEVPAALQGLEDEDILTFYDKRSAQCPQR